MSSNPSSSPPLEHPPEQPQHLACAGLACLGSSDTRFAGYHRRLHAHLAPLLDEHWRGHRFPTHVVPIAYEEALALREACKLADATNQRSFSAVAAGASPSAASATASSSALASVRQRLETALSSDDLFGSRGATVSFNSVSVRDGLLCGRFRRRTLEALLKVHIESMTAEGQRTEQSVVLELANCVGRAMQLHDADEVLEALASSPRVQREIEEALSFGRKQFVANVVLTEFQPQIILHPSSHFRCTVSRGRVITCSQRAKEACFPQLQGAQDRILRGVEDFALHMGLPPALGGAEQYVIDVIVLGPPIIAADEERDCSETPIATQSPSTNGHDRDESTPPPIVAPEEREKQLYHHRNSARGSKCASDSSGSDSSASPPPTESGHKGTHEAAGRPAPPYPSPYDIRLLHVRALPPLEIEHATNEHVDLGLFTLEELRSMVAAMETGKDVEAECRVREQPLQDIMASVPPLWRRFIETECKPPPTLGPLLELLHDLTPSLLVVAGALGSLMLLLRASFLRSLLLALGVALATYAFPYVRRRRRHPSDKASLVRMHSSQLKLAPEEVLRKGDLRPGGISAAATASPAITTVPSAAELAAIGRDAKPGTSNVRVTGVAKHQVFLSTPHALFSRIRQLDLTPLIRVELSPRVALPFALADQHSPNTDHLKGSKRVVVNYLCGPRLVLRMARYAAGSHRWRPLGSLSGMQLLSLLLPHERYNFVLTSRPLRVVISHVGPGTAGGLYAKHALLSELHNVAFAGELWLDERSVVHVNNSSGTYKPKDRLLPAVEKFLAAALQIQVHAHKRPDKDEDTQPATTTSPAGKSSSDADA